MPALTEEQKRLVENNLGLAYRVFHKAVRLYPALDEDAIESMALYGLVRAALNYNPARSKFSTAATFHCKGWVKREIDRQMDNRSGVVSLDSPVHEGCDDTLISFLEDTSVEHPGEAIERKEIVAKCMRKLCVLDRKIVQLHCCEGEALGDIGKQLGISRSAATRRYLYAITKLRRSVPRWGVKPWLQNGFESWAKRHPKEKKKTQVRALSNARIAGMEARRREREVVGWPDLPAIQGEILAHLYDGKPVGTLDIASATESGLAYCRNALSALKADGRVERVGGGGMGGQVIYKITKKAVEERVR